MRKFLMYSGMVLWLGCLSGCVYLGWGPKKDVEHTETEKQQGALLKQGAGKIRSQGTAPESTDAVKVDALATTLSQSLGMPATPVDFENNAQVQAVNALLTQKTHEFEAKEKSYQEKVGKLDAALGTAQTLLGIGGVAFPVLGGIALMLARGRAAYKQFAKAQVVGTSQLKATYDHARIAITDMAKTDKDAALQAALGLLNRDTINPLLRNGVEAMGGSKNLESMLMLLKDEVEQNLLNRPLIDPKILIHNNAQ